MTLVQLQYFQTICQYNNLTRAAKALHVSQPTLTHTIQELEQEFGITLFLRQNKGLVLTNQGQTFLNEVNILLNQATSFTNRMSFLGESQKIVHLGLSPASATLFFPVIARSLYDKYPDTQIHIVENGSMLNRQKILDGKLDLAIISSDSPIPSTLSSYHIASTKVCLYISKQDDLANYKTLSIETLKKTPLVMLSEESFLTTSTMDKFARYKAKPNIILTTNQIAIIEKLIRSHTAATLLFENTLPPSDDYISIPIEEFQNTEIYLIWNQYKVITPAMDHLIKITKEIYPES